MLGDVFVLVIITVVALVFASVIDGEFLIRGDVLQPFVVEHIAIFVMCSLDLDAGEWICFNSKFSFEEFPYQLRARCLISLIRLRYCLLHTRYGSMMLVLTNQCLDVMLWFLS